MIILVVEDLYQRGSSNSTQWHWRYKAVVENDPSKWMKGASPEDAVAEFAERVAVAFLRRHHIQTYSAEHIARIVREMAK